MVAIMTPVLEDNKARQDPLETQDLWVQREIPSRAPLVHRAHQAPQGLATTVVQETQAHQVLPGPQGPTHYQGPTDLPTPLVFLAPPDLLDHLEFLVTPQG